MFKRIAFAAAAATVFGVAFANIQPDRPPVHPNVRIKRLTPEDVALARELEQRARRAAPGGR